MIERSTSVSFASHECQMVIELPAGEGDMGDGGGSSVGVTPGVPVIRYGVGDGTLTVPPGRVGVTDFDGVRVGLDVGVACGP